jgi:hypothetical protein
MKEGDEGRGSVRDAPQLFNRTSTHPKSPGLNSERTNRRSMRSLFDVSTVSKQIPFPSPVSRWTLSRYRPQSSTLLPQPPCSSLHDGSAHEAAVLPSGHPQKPHDLYRRLAMTQTDHALFRALSFEECEIGLTAPATQAPLRRAEGTRLQSGQYHSESNRLLRDA